MEACNEVVDQLRAVDEAEGRVEEYRRMYLEHGQALVADKDAWIKTWQAKVSERAGRARAKGRKVKRAPRPMCHGVWSGRRAGLSS
jgi:hypothetical protein